MCFPSDQAALTPQDAFVRAVHGFASLMPADDVPAAFEAVRTALLDLIQTSPDPNAFTHSLAMLQVAGPIESGDLEKLQERVRYAYSMLP